jgi:hypothetical protein
VGFQFVGLMFLTHAYWPSERLEIISGRISQKEWRKDGKAEENWGMNGNSGSGSFLRAQKDRVDRQFTFFSFLIGTHRYSLSRFDT